MSTSTMLRTVPLAHVFRPLPRFAGEITVTDHFAGAGGSSTGMAQIPGLTIKHASNHWNLAIQVHNANHPDADHSSVDLHQENPAFFPSTEVLWASPECTKWSGASGKQRPAIEEGLFEDPESDDAAVRSRLLMFDVLRFAEYHRYRMIVVENVTDIATQTQYANAWAEWRRQLRNLGYLFRVVSINSMHAQLYGMPAPQSRDRIYIVCWLAGTPAPNLEPMLRPRAYCPKCDHLVESQQSWKNGRTVGKYRQTYVYVHGECGTVVEPGWLPAAAALDLSNVGERIGDRKRPLTAKTIDRIAAGIARYWNPLAVPVEGRDGKNAQPLDWPARTQTTRAETGLASLPFILDRRGEYRIRELDDPLSTITANDTTKALIDPRLPFVAELRGGSSDARAITEPAATFCASGNHHALITPYYGRSDHAKPTSDPMGTLTTVDRYALIHRNNGGGPEMTTPAFEAMRTLTTAGHQSVLQAGPRGGRPEVTPRDLREARAMVDDCYFRMFTPAEVAAGMAFPDTYDWQPDSTRKITNRDLVKMGGNAVTPPVSRDIGGCIVESWDGVAA